MLLLMILSPIRDPFKEIIHAYLFILVAIFTRNLLLYFTYFSDDLLSFDCVLTTVGPIWFTNVFITVVLCVTEEHFSFLICF